MLSSLFKERAVSKMMFSILISDTNQSYTGWNHSVDGCGK